MFCAFLILASDYKAVPEIPGVLRGICLAKAKYSLLTPLTKRIHIFLSRLWQFSLELENCIGIPRTSEAGIPAKKANPEL